MSGRLVAHKVVAPPVLLLRFDGTIDGDALFTGYRDLVTADPELMNFAQIWDCRSWRGALFDSDIETHRAWNLKFRQDHGLATEGLRPIVILARAGSGLQALESQLTLFRRRQIPIVEEIAAAWAIVADDAPMPRGTRRFLKPGIFARLGF